MSTSPDYTVYYLPGFGGRSEPILTLLLDAGKHYTLSNDVKGFLDHHPKVFACPVVVDHKNNGFVLSQTVAILSYLGKKLGYYCPENDARGLQLSMCMSDIWSESYESRKGADCGAAFLKDRLPKWLSVFEASIQGKYFLGDKLTFVDFHAVNVVTLLDFMYGHLAMSQIATYPKLSAWLQVAHSLKGVQEYKKLGHPVLFPAVKAKY